MGMRESTQSERIGQLPAVEIRIREADGENARSRAGWRDGRISRAVVLFLVMAIAGSYTWVHIGRGWVAADDGTLASSALRVLDGQLPHRDFAEIYSGGLSFIHAFAFRLLGVNLMSLRICVFLFFMAWLPAVYWIALRFTSPLAAGAITLLAVAWSYPNYPAAMPSWYNLFFATFGAAALLRYLETRSKRWLVVAGMCGGVSFLIKVIGAYYVAACLLFFAFVEQSESEDAETSQNSWAYRVFSISALLAFLAVVVYVLRTRLGSSELYEFVFPPLLVAGLIAVGEWAVKAASAQRFKTMALLVLPFVGGMLMPVGIFLIPYARSGMVGKYFLGVGSSAMSRAVDLGVIRPLGLEGILYVLPLVGLLAAAMYWEHFQGAAVGVTLAIGAAFLAYRATALFSLMKGIWFSAAALTPIAVLLGAALVWLRRMPGDGIKIKRQQVVLLMALAGMCTLVQYPFAAPIYFSYAAPLTLLAVVAIVSAAKIQRGTYVLASVLGLYLVFGVVTLVPNHIYEITYKVGRMDRMNGPRAGGLNIDGAAFFDELSAFLHAHSPNGLMFAGNDCPELYFLSGLRNIANDDTGEPPEVIMKAIQSEDLNLVVINESPYFPAAVMDPQVKAEVIRRFPHGARFGIFDVFWKQ